MKLAALPSAWLLAFLALPAALLARQGLSAEGLAVFADASVWALLARSAGVAALVTVLCLAVAYPAAAFIAGCSPAVRALLLLLVLLPYWTNLLARTYAMTVVLRPLGVLYTPAAVVAGLVHSFLPFMLLPLVSSLERIPASLLEAARDLGAGPAQTFRNVTLPLSLPGIAAGSFMVFVPVLGIFALPEILGGASLPLAGMEINTRFKQDPASPAGSALTLALLAIMALPALVAWRLRKRAAP
jgi:spermidine/putrescine transport system permease protein